MALPNRIVNFWLEQPAEKYFQKDEKFDAEITDKYALHVRRAAGGDYYKEWREQPKSTLALILLLDQFSRNVYRNSPLAYSGDEQARYLTRLSVKEGYDEEFETEHRQWFYLPLMHSENLQDQDYGIELFEKAGLEDNLKFAREHSEIITRFGRFPHRNKVLGRKSTPEEIEYLSNGGFTG